MARVKLDNHDISDEGSPAVCMRCGQPSSIKPSKVFRWNPGWVYLLILVGLLPFLVVALVMSWHRKVVTPLCDQHADYWRFRSRFILGGLLGVIVAVVAIAASAPTVSPAPPWVIAIWIGVAALAVVWLFGAAVVQASSIRAAEITDSRITLLSVHPDFAAAIRQLHDERAARELDPTVRQQSWPRSQRSEFYDD
jgi:hypothetical protein